MIEKKKFIKSLSTLFFSWGGETPEEVIWVANDLLDWFESEFNVLLCIRFERDEETYALNFNEVIERIEKL